jgi:hypothetical protein
MRLLPGPTPYLHTDRWVSVWRHPLLWRKAGRMMAALRAAATRPRPTPFLLLSPRGDSVIECVTVSRALLWMRHGWRLVRKGQ